MFTEHVLLNDVSMIVYARRLDLVSELFRVSCQALTLCSSDRVWVKKLTLPHAQLLRK